MKRIIRTLCVLLAGTIGLTSCLGSESDTELTDYRDMAITSFTLSTINRYVSTKSTKTGNDTIVKNVLSGTTYAMTIDQLGHQIYNQNPLPQGTDVKHVLCTIGTKNSGVVALKSKTSDSLVWFSTSDSIDFSVPRVFRVYAIDGSGSRDYTVTLNVSSTQGAAFKWTQGADIPAADLSSMRLVTVADTVQLIPADGLIGSTANMDYLMGTDGQLMGRLIGTTAWQPEAIDEADSLLPATGTASLVSWPYAPADNTDYVLMVGTPRQDDATSMRVWRKIAPHEGGGQWVFMPFDDDNQYFLPRQELMSLALFEGTVLAIGSQQTIYQSRDQGITWRKVSEFELPTTLTGAQVLMAGANGERLFLVTNTGQVWTGTRK